MGAILAILGIILKIIAWILLGLLGLIILVSLLILLPSLRYYIEGAKTEEDAHITARLSFSCTSFASSSAGKKEARPYGT